MKVCRTTRKKTLRHSLASSVEAPPAIHGGWAIPRRLVGIHASSWCGGAGALSPLLSRSVRAGTGGPRVRASSCPLRFSLRGASMRPVGRLFAPSRWLRCSSRPPGRVKKGGQFYNGLGAANPPPCVRSAPAALSLSLFAPCGGARIARASSLSPPPVHSARRASPGIAAPQFRGRTRHLIIK